MEIPNEGIVAIWKPKGPTSHDMISRVRKMTGVRRVGHAGTLDPLASGILVIGIGRTATKTLGLHQATDKEYIASGFLGKTSTTGDAEGVIASNDSNKFSIPSKLELIATFSKFVGLIDQMPPLYSAIKIGGKAAYEYARTGKTITLKSRKVRIISIDLLYYRYPRFRLRVVSGPGMYVRSLIADIGASLGMGAYMSGLIRTRVGIYTRDGAYTIPVPRLKKLIIRNSVKR